MATIDELVLVLGLDPSRFTAGQKIAIDALKKLEEQAVKSGKEAEGQSKKLLDFFANLKKEVLGFLAAFYGGKGIGEMVQHITRLDASAARLAPTINTNVEALAKWRIMFREMGFSAEEADANLSSVAETLQDFARHLDQPPMAMLNVLRRIGMVGETDPDKILTRMAELARTMPPAQFAPIARDMGLSRGMIQLLADPRFEQLQKAAEALTPKGGGLGAFSKDFITAIGKFDVAAENLARVLLDWFVPAINSLTGLLTKWLAPPGTVEAKKIETDFDKHLREHFGPAPQGPGWDWLRGLFGVEPLGNPPKMVPRGDTGIGGVFGGATGFQVEEGGVVVNSGVFTGAKGAAAVSSVNNSRSTTRSSTMTNETNINTINVQTQATDAPGVAKGISGALKGSLSAPFPGGTQ